MKLEHIFVGKPVDVPYNGQNIKTGIYKNKVQGKVKVHSLNIEGDQQADLSVHGGIDKAVYAYPIEHYNFWKERRNDLQFEPGTFGENLSVSGLDEQVCIGDQFKIGQVIFGVTSPRMPCFKLGIKMKDPGFTRDFMQEGRNGFYFKVLQEGEMEAGNSIEKLSDDRHGLTIAEVIQLYTTRKQDKILLEKAINSPSLPIDWIDYFEVKLKKLAN